MIKLTPVITEKSMNLATTGSYTFYVDKSLTKGQIKEAVEKTFSVEVNRVRTINSKGLVKKNAYGKKIVVKSRKKAIVTLKGSGKIDLFETKEDKK